MAHPGSASQWPPPPTGAAAGSGVAERAFRWFRVYAAAMVLLYVVCAAAAAFVLTYDFDLTSAERDQMRVQGAIFFLGCLAMIPVFAIGLFLPRKQWSWIYGLVLLGLGLTSCCTWPATIPLLIAWLKPEMKARFGRT